MKSILLKLITILRRNYVTSALAITSLIGLVVALAGDYLSESEKNIWILVFPISALLAFASNRLFSFLNTDIIEKEEIPPTFSERLQAFSKERNTAYNVGEAFDRNPDVLNEDSAAYVLTANLESALIDRLEKRFQAKFKSEFPSNAIASELTPLIRNVEAYINRIQRNSIVNLFIGIVATATAIVILAFAILNNQQFATLQDFLIHFLPRFTFVAFIQVFAFFFLKLYKSNLDDAKYFQNELTNLTAKVASIKISYLMGGAEQASDLVKELAATERNFKLQKEETTIGIEKMKLDNQFDKSMLDSFKDLLSKYELKKD